MRMGLQTRAARYGISGRKWESARYEIRLRGGVGSAKIQGIEVVASIQHNQVHINVIMFNTEQLQDTDILGA